MKKSTVLRKLSLRLVLLATIIIAFSFGCANFSISQSVQPSANAPPMRSTLHWKSSDSATVSPTEVLLDPSSSAITPEDIVWEMIGQINIDGALNNLQALTGESPICINNECYTIKNRLTGSEGLGWAKQYIYKEISNLGFSVEFRDWSRSGRSDQNIVIRKPGALHPEEEIYFVAHLDGVGGSSEVSYPGADDNASGVVDILELARVLSHYSFSRTIVLLITTGEEQGTLGSQSYLSQLTPIELSSIKYVVNLDMLGYDANQDGVMELWHGGHAPSIELVNTMSEIIQAYQLDLSPGFVVGCG